MADSVKSPSKSQSPIKNPYAKTASPERQVISPVGANASNTNPKTPPRTNPYLKNITPVTADAKSASNDAAASPSATPSKLTPAQQARIEQNRKRALERRIQSLEQQEPNKKARLQQGNQVCIRCGSTNENTLCIQWNHEGEIQRERSYTGWDIFRYDCCGRLSPSCCFVGRHEFSKSPHGLVPWSNISISCNCHNGPAKLLCTRKDNQNCGRYFFKCSGNGINGCDFFMWADKAFSLPYMRCLPARDGIKEWIHIYANPFDQDMNWLESTACMVPKPLPILRERLIAALLMHKCCESVSGGWVASNPHLEDFASTVEKVFKTQDLAEQKKLVLNGLHPLTQVQITNRFGVTFQYEGPLFGEVPSFEECHKALAKATRENAVLRSCAVKIEPFTHPTSGMSATFIPLEGLENYLAC